MCLQELRDLGRGVGPAWPKRVQAEAQRSRYLVKDAAASPQIHEVTCLPLRVAGLLHEACSCLPRVLYTTLPKSRLLPALGGAI